MTSNSRFANMLRLASVLGPAAIVVALVANPVIGSKIVSSSPWTTLTIIGSMMSTAAITIAANRFSRKEASVVDIAVSSFIEAFKKAAANSSNHARSEQLDYKHNSA